ncbi:uncharacterized protein LOC124797698 [Schistocerca piceifrons]|uniref:uncharacterized protein LOC124797698 n=1 Tax=Schistocerca piceifrons TaxID=274613 RepID=UPI001F5EA383|nr:uncharacterized protein LOC124797698 [Schistocerca piceifrons]XP_047116762.1 uncharacterized protein LOC124797698 [Schistocerca piceifrons]XP_047116763.1 uncharacterized protein LOC124797698 [Schistocerca piceifrons]
MRGQDYLGMQKDEFGKKRPTMSRIRREIKPRCTCKHSSLNRNRNCKDITEEQRQLIFNHFWQDTSWGERKIFVRSHVYYIPVKRRRNNLESNKSHHSNTLYYNFVIGGQRKTVCKTMFLNTLCLGEWSVGTWVFSASGITLAEGPQMQERPTKVSGGRQTASDFFAELPKLESHYCHHSSTKLYLEPNWQSTSELHRKYIEFCKKRGQIPSAYKQFCEVFDENNPNLFSPKKDQCNLCCSHQTGNISDNEYFLHMAQKTEAKEAKNSDKLGPARVFTMDLKALLLSPRLKASAPYYKSKLKGPQLHHL